MKTNPFKRFLRTGIVLLVGASVMACGGNEPDDPTPTPAPDPGTDPPPVVVESEKTERGAKIHESGVDINMPATSVFVKEDINNYLVEYDEPSGRLVFKTCTALDDAGIKVGDVLFSGIIPGIAPEGYLVKVDRISRTDSRTTFETTKAGLSDAFDDLTLDYSMSSVQLSPEDFTVYDPFLQDDLTPQENPLTRGISSDLDFTKDKYVLSGDKFKLDVTSESAKLQIVLMDMDDDYEKTTNDQAILEFDLNYELLDGSFKFNKSGEGGFINAGMDLKLGGFAGLKFGYEKKKYGEKELIKAIDREAMNDFQTEVEKKLMGKKIRVASMALPVKAIPGIGTVLASLIDPRIDLYIVFNVKPKGTFKIGFVWEKAKFDFQVGNSGENFAETDEKKTRFDVNLGDVHFDLLADGEIKGSIGAGVGLVVRAAKMVSWLADGDEKPYVGGFFEFTGNLDLGFKTSLNMTDHVLEGELSGKAYFKTEAFLEAYAQMTKPAYVLWHFKMDWPKLTYTIPNPPLELKIPFVIEAEQPIPYCLFPEDRGIIQESQVDLGWDLPFHMNAGTAEQGLFDGIVYTVYAGKDRRLVEQSDPSVCVATGLSKGEKQCTLTVEPMKTYYWKVVCKNQYDMEYTSQIWSFDTGYDGVIALNEPLRRFLSNYRETLPGVRIEEDGLIFRTPSNVAALNQLSTLVIQDPGRLFGIESIDDLLVHLPALTVLNCKHNKIRSLALANNPRLTGIACDDNAIATLDLRGAPNLTGLNCSGNSGLKVLDLSPCPNLTAVNCEKCQIEEINLRFSQELQDLYAAENNLSFLDVSRCPQLLRLDVYSQSQEKLTLRLTSDQMKGFAYFKRHFNMEFDYVDIVSGIITEEATQVTNHSATVEVTVLERNNYTHMGVAYSFVEQEPDFYSSYSNTITLPGVLHAFFNLEDLRPDMDYYVRGYAFSANSPVVYGNVIHFKTGARDPVPEILIDPDTFEFENVETGTSSSKSLIIKNVGELDLTYEIVPPSGSQFSATPATSRTLKPDESQTVTLTFSPTRVGEEKAIFTVRSNDPRGDQTFTAWGTGIKPGPGPTPDPNAVDLGLSVKWAAFNLGASAPEERGNYYAWGETEMQYARLDPLVWKDGRDSGYIWETYRWCRGTYDSLTKYCNRSNYGYNGYTDKMTTLELETDDAANAILGGNWRMPTRGEWSELINNCTTTWTTENDVEGYRFTSRKNGNSIFIPTAGWFYEGEFSREDSGFYWTSNLTDSPDSAWIFYLSEGRVNPNSSSTRSYGLSIRPVYDELLSTPGGDIEWTEEDPWN